MNAKKKSAALTLALIFVIPIFVLGAGALSVYIAYMRQKAQINEEIEKLPLFDVEKESRAIAKSLGVDYPVRQPERTMAEIEKAVGETLEKALEKNYSTEIYSEKINDLIKKYSLAQPGDTVKFYIKPLRDQITQECITGVYGGIEDRGLKGKLAIIDRTKQYPLTSIDPDYLYLFVPHTSDMRQREEIEKFKKEFQEAKDAYAELNKTKIEKKLFGKEGYCVDANGKWLNPADMLKKELEKKGKAHKTARMQKMAEIIDSNKLFGIFRIEIQETQGTEP